MADNKNTDLFKYLERRRSALELERSSFDSHWKALAENIQPRRGRWFVSDTNKGARRHQYIINSAGTQALRAASAGLFAGVMSPTRPWFNLAIQDQELSQYQPVSVWLRDVEKIIYGVFNQSNLYNMAPVMLSELLLFATGCMVHDSHPATVARFYTQTVGSYYLGQNEMLEIDTYLRQMQMRVGGIVGQFGLDNVPTTVKDLYNRGSYDKEFKVLHMIEPRKERSEDNPFNDNMPFRSVYWMQEDNEKRILKESGFEQFPVYAPRWGTTGEDIYGTDCPGMVVLGDVRQLQTQEKRKQQAIDKLVNPPLKGPPSLRNTEVNALPGGVTAYENNQQAGDGLSPLFTVQPQIREMVLDIDKTERRIQEGFFVDLFQAITRAEGSQYKNEEEIISRNEEKLLQLGPVLEQLHGEFLDKLIDRTFNQLLENELLPPPPEELQGSELKVNYISSLAQAQRAVAVGSIERLMGFVSSMAQVKPEALDKFDFDQAIDEYGQAILSPPKLIKTDDAVEQAREQRQQFAIQQQQAQQEAQEVEALSALQKSGGPN